MLHRAKKSFEDLGEKIWYAVKNPLFWYSTFIVGLRALTNWGETDFRTKNTLVYFSDDVNPNDAYAQAITNAAIIACLGTVILTRGLLVYTDYMGTKESDITEPEHDIEAQEEQEEIEAAEHNLPAPVSANFNFSNFCIFMGVLNLYIFMPLGTVNSNIRLKDWWTASNNDPNDISWFLLIFSVLSAAFQVKLNRRSIQEEMIKNATSNEKIIDGKHILLSTLIVADSIASAALYFQSTCGALEKIPYKKLRLDWVADESFFPLFLTFIGAISCITSGFSRFYTNGAAIKQNFHKGFDRPPNTRGWKAYYVISTFFIIPDALVFSPINGVGSYLFFFKNGFNIACQFSDLWHSAGKGCIVLTACISSGISGIFIWKYNERLREKIYHELAIKTKAEEELLLKHSNTRFGYNTFSSRPSVNGLLGQQHRQTNPPARRLPSTRHSFQAR